MQEITLGDLIESSRHRRGEKSLSYAELAKLCGGKPTAARLQQYVTGDLKNFPDPDSIRGLAKGTRATPREIVLASARSLGLHIEPEAEDLLLIQGSSTLPDSALESLKSIGRELVNLSRKADHAPSQHQFDNSPDSRSDSMLRTVAPEGDARSRQKIDSLTPEEIRLVAMRENRRLRREESNYITGMTQAHAYADSLREQGKNPQEVREALTAMRESIGEELAELRAAGKAIEKEETAKIKSQGGSVSGYARHGSITEFHGDEAKAIPVPAREQLAAKRGVKTRREQLDEQTGEHGTNFQTPDNEEQ